MDKRPCAHRCAKATLSPRKDKAARFGVIYRPPLWAGGVKCNAPELDPAFPRNAHEKRPLRAFLRDDGRVERLRHRGERCFGSKLRFHQLAEESSATVEFVERPAFDN